MSKRDQITIPRQEGWEYPHDYIPSRWRFFGVCLICEGGPVAGTSGCWYARCMRCARAHFIQGEEGYPVEILLRHLRRFPKAVGE